MPQATLSIRVNSADKQKFERFCSDVGMNVSTAVNLYIKKVLMEYRIPFAISKDIPNSETAAAVREVQEMKAHPEKGKTYTDVDNMMKELLA